MSALEAAVSSVCHAQREVHDEEAEWVQTERWELGRSKVKQRSGGRRCKDITSSTQMGLK